MLYLRTEKENGVIAFYPLNPDAIYYKCEECGEMVSVESYEGLCFDDRTFLGEYICKQCEDEIEDELELQKDEEFQTRFEKAIKEAGIKNSLPKESF